LTEEQFQILYSLEDNPRMLIRGCAGSGKTMLAEHKAKRLADQGYQVLLTCYNHQLAAWLRERPSLAERPGLCVAHFHDVCRQAAAEAREVELPDWSSGLGISRQAYYQRTMPEALELAAVELGLSFDAIIVDEGQDFQESWLRTLYNLLTEPEQGIFYIFYDDNQRVYKKGNIPFRWPTFRLTRNMRNTDPIFDVLLEYYDRRQKVLPSGVSGPAPLRVQLDGYADEYEAVQDVLARLAAEAIAPDRVAILTPKDKRASLWGQLEARSGRFTPVWQLKPSENQVTCSSIRTFKGLERPVIILTELGRMEDWQVGQMMYVAISRAKTYLVVIGELPTLAGE
jgi:superfamily I DNA/RNA helicase